MTTIPRQHKKWPPLLTFLPRIVLVLLIASVLIVLHLTSATLAREAAMSDRFVDPKALRREREGSNKLTGEGKPTDWWKTGDQMNGVYSISTKQSSVCPENDPCKLSFPWIPEHPTHGNTDFSTFSHIVTRKGDKGGSPNQDRGLLVTHSSQNFVLAVMFDGHGPRGHTSAETVIRELPFQLLQQPNLESLDSSQIQRLFQETFLRVDEGPVQSISESGATAVVALQIQSRLYIATAGDSIGLVIRYSPKKGKVETIARAIKHKPADPLEQKRIEAAGGSVFSPPDPQFSSRVMYDTPDGQQMFLAMSRSLGDPDGKKPGYLIADPSVVIIDDLEAKLKGHEDVGSFLFLIVASDGVFDMIPEALITTTLGQALADANNRDTLQKACNEVMEHAARGWAMKMLGQYRDDMTLIVTRLKV